MSEHHEFKIQRVSDPADPNRCQANNAMGQCLMISVPGAKYCSMHSGEQIRQKQNKEKLRIYRIAKYQSRLNEHSDHSGIKSLREEIGILRILAEERFNSCKDNFDLILQSSQISDLIVKIEKLVSSCHRIDLQLGGMLDKTQAIQLAAEIVETISRHVEDEEALERISSEILEIVDRISKAKVEVEKSS